MMARFETDVFPWLGKTPIAKVTGPMLLEVCRRIEDRGVIETAHRALQDSSKVFARRPAVYEAMLGDLAGSL